MNGKKKGILSNIYDGVINETLVPFIEKVTNLLLLRIDIDAESLKTLKEYSRKGSIVYASYHSSNFSLLVLYNALRTNGIETPAFALEYNPFLLQTLRFVWKRIIKFLGRVIFRRKYKYILDTDYVETLLRNRRSVLLSLLSRKFFLMRYMEIKYDSLIYLVELQKKMDTPIFLCPQIIFWNRNPERTAVRITASRASDVVRIIKYLLFNAFRGRIMESKATGDKGIIAGWLSALKSATPPFVRIAAPINLKEELKNAKTDDARQIAIKIRNTLLETYHYEKRTVLGPVLKSHREMMERVLYHKNVLEEIERLSREEGIPEWKLKKKAYKYYREIAADFSIVVVRYFAMAAAWFFRKVFDGIAYDPDSLKQIREASKKGPLIITPSHKSHIDYLLISFIFYMNKMIPPHIVAGVNLTFFPMGFIFRHSGAFFIRRSFRGLQLYPVIFKQYVKTLISEGYSIEFFIEGGRSRTGKLVLPKFGLLNYLIEAIEEGYNKDLVFIPISINYDRILEETSYVEELKGKEKEAESALSMMESSRLLSRKYGKAYISINAPIRLKEIAEKAHRGENIPEVVAQDLIRRINDVTVVTPFALTTTALLLSSVKGFSKKILYSRLVNLYTYLVYNNVTLSESLMRKSNIDEIIDYVIKSYQEDKIIEELKIGESRKSGKEVVGDLFALREENRSRIVFYKNSIIHYLIPLAFTSLGLLCADKRGDINKKAVKDDYQFIKDFFSKEFVYSRKDEAVESSVQSVRGYLLFESIVAKKKNRIIINPDRTEDLLFYSRIIQDYLESYYIVLDTIINTEAGHLNRRELLLDIRKNGIRMFHLGEVYLAEALSIPNYNTAMAKFIDEGIISEKVLGRKNVEVEILDREKAKVLAARLKSYISIIG